MIYELGRYRRTIVPQIKTWIENRPNCNRVEEIGLIALSTECPIVVVATFMGELYGFDPALLSLLQVLKDFYRVEEIK